MPSPFLLAHRTADGVFDIAGALSPGAVRDQIIRSVGIIRAAHASSFIKARTAKPQVIIVGGGMAGVAAGIEAHKLSISALVIQPGPALAPLQTSCDSRIIDCAAYDWPAPHHADSTFNFNFPYLLTHGVAGEVVRGWVNEFRNRELDTASPVRLRHIRGKVENRRQTREGWTIELDDASQLSAPMLLLATGSSEEEPRFTFRSHSFWEPDPLLEPRAGLSADDTLLISGGGDGALQDLFRVVLTQSAPRSLLQTLAIPDAIRQNVADLEDAFHRRFIWSYKEQDHALFHKHHEDYMVLALSLLTTTVVNRLRNLIRPRNQRPRVVIAHKCNHFGRCYPLNRLVAILLKLIFDRQEADLTVESKSLVFLDNVKTANIRCDHEAPFNNPGHCYGKPHSVALHQHQCDRDAPSTVPSDLKANAILLRWGVSASSASGDRLARQHLPYAAH